MSEYLLPFKQGDIIAELGGGDKPLFRPNIDIRKLPNVDIVIDLNLSLPIPDNSYDGIFCQYILEHLSWRRLKKFLSEIYRVLRSGGIIVFITADLLEQARVLVNTPQWDENLIRMIFGGQKFSENEDFDEQWYNNAHHNGFSPSYITGILKDIGFGDIKILHIQTCVGPTDMIIEVKKPIMTQVIIKDKKDNHPFNRSYFEGGTYTGAGYQDFPVHYNTVKLILDREPESVIDIGGARGYIAKKLNDAGIYATCIDISEHCYHTRATDNFVLHDITKIPYPFRDKEFDLAISISLLEHIPEEHIPSVIREMARISKRGFHGITFHSSPNDIDKTHINIKPKEWWEEKFREYASIYADYKYEILDKEDTEKGIVQIPVTDNLLKINIGSFINMHHHSWQNIDNLDLSEFANVNGYIFKQYDVTKGLPYNDNSVDIIVSSHFIEHLDRKEGSNFLKECYRTLKSNSIIRLTIPDTELLVKKYLSNQIDEYKYVNIGVENSPDNSQSLFELLLAGHKTIYDFDSLSKLLSKIGFTNIQKMRFNNSGSKLIERETIDMYPSLSLYVEATKPENINNIYENINNIHENINNIHENINNIHEHISSQYIKGPIITKGPTNGSINKKDDSINNNIYYKKLRIALISTPFFTVPPKQYGGLEQIVWNLANGLDELGHDVTIFGPEGSRMTEHGHIIATCASINTVNTNWFEQEKLAYEKYKDIITSDKFDIVHGHTWFGFEYLLKINNPSLNVVHTHHGGFGWETQPPFVKPNLVAISNYMKNYTIQYFKNLGYNVDCQYVYNGIDIEEYKYNISNKQDRLLYVGRFSKFKQPHVAIEIANRANLPIDLIGGTFVDDPNYLRDIESMCDGDKIAIYKDVSNEFKIKKMQGAKALLFLSKMGEPFGLVALEAMSCGTPVIATNDGAIPEIVLHGKTGFICDTEKEILEAIKNIDNIDPLECRKRSEKFSRLNMAKNYEMLYRNVITRKDW